MAFATVSVDAGQSNMGSVVDKNANARDENAEVVDAEGDNDGAAPRPKFDSTPPGNQKSTNIDATKAKEKESKSEGTKRPRDRKVYAEMSKFPTGLLCVCRVRELDLI